MFAPNRFSDRGLCEESLKAFVKALHTDRMVAITGSMATGSLGYPSWDDFTKAYALIADALAREIIEARGDDDDNQRISTYSLLKDIRERARDLIEDVDNKEDSERFAADRRVSMWTLHELFRSVDREMRHTHAGLVIKNRYQTSSLAEFERRVGAIFISRRREGPLSGAIRPLVRSLGIKRFATLNYDLELERILMLRRDEQLLVSQGEMAAENVLQQSAEPGSPASPGGRSKNDKALRLALGKSETATPAELYAVKYQQLPAPPIWPAKEEKPGVMTSILSFIGAPDEGKPIIRHERNRLSRTMGDGVHVESDVVHRERPDRLFEFAIGSAEISRHILHIHGRSDAPDTMVANIRQYDRLYRLDDLYRDPFDHGLRMLIGGNPILFVGIGMRENEINDQLQYFISNTPIRRPAPIFVLWNGGEEFRTTDNGKQNQKKRQAKEQEWLRAKKARRLDFRIRLGVHLIFDDDFEIEPSDADQRPTPAERLPKMMESLPALVKRVDRRIERRASEWRSIERRIAESRQLQEPCRMWGSEGLCNLWAEARKKNDPRFTLPALEGRKKKKDYRPLIFAASENGFGRGELSEYIAWSDQPGFHIGRSAIAPSQPVNRLLVNAGFSYDSDAMLSGIARFLAMRSSVEPTEVEDCRERLFANGRLLRMDPQTLIVINGADRFFGSDGAPLSAEFDHFLRCVDAYGDHLQVLLLCTSRMLQYARGLGYMIEPLQSAGLGPHRQHPRNLPEAAKHLNSSYLSWVAHCFEQRRIELEEADKTAERELHAKGKSKEEIDLYRKNAARVAADRHLSAASQALIRRADTVDRDAQKRIFFEAYLFPPLLRALGVSCPATFEVLRTLSFIGTPVEGVVLLYAPKVRAILAERNETPHSDLAIGKEAPADATGSYRTDAFDAAEVRERLVKVLRDLRELGLLIVLDPHDPGGAKHVTGKTKNRRGEHAEAGQKTGQGPNATDEEDDEAILWRRYGMHRSLATYLRDLHGAPINDAKLATTFNMSMFMSDSSDAAAPETGFHEELGDLADTLAGAWHDVAEMQPDTDIALGRLDPSSSNRSIQDRGRIWLRHFKKLRPKEQTKEPLYLTDLYIAKQDKDQAIKNLPWHAHRDAAACLRAALSVVRGYYSTGALLRFDRVDRVAHTDRDGALTEHARRLDRLISVFGDIAIARSILQRTAESLQEKLRKEGKEAKAIEAAANDFAREIGPEPFYADDLVWLLNERATVALAQGDLFEARDAFSAADRVNAEHVEQNYHGHNWRRIAIGRAALRIERGSLKPAERLIDEIELSVNSAPWCKAVGPTHGSRVDCIRELGTKHDVTPLHGNKQFTREEILVVAMATGYRGLIAHLRGRYHEAKGRYKIAVRLLRRLGEQRAYAHFQRHWATLEGFFGDKVRALQEINHAIAAAQAARQMDILHRARVVRADLIRETSPDAERRRSALQDIKEALRYAALADCYRVRIEASASLARHMRISGDYDTALRYGVDAMTIAARYGHSLQKTSLRIELGRILEARGDPISGRALLDQAIAIGTSKGHHHALERIRRVTDPAPSTNWTYLTTKG